MALLFIVIFFILGALSTPLIMDNSQPTLGDIGRVQHLINSGQYTGAQLGQLYFQLGYLFHNAWLNKLKTGHQSLLLEAEEAFRSSLAYLEGDYHLIPLVIEVLSVRGVVLKMLGNAAESLMCYEKALSYPLHDADRASLYHCLGDTYLMMDDYQTALAQYEASLALAPCKTERYHSYVNAAKAYNQYSKDEWRDLLANLIKAEQECHNLDSKGQESNNKKRRTEDLELMDFDSDFENIFPDEEDIGLYSDEDLLVTLKRTPKPDKPYLFSEVNSGYYPSKQSDLYYALYTVADIVGEHALAWQYLQRANDEEHKHRKTVFDAEQSIYMKNATVSVFVESFVESFPNLMDYEELLADYQLKYANPIVSKFRRAQLKKQKGVSRINNGVSDIQGDNEVEESKGSSKQRKSMKQRSKSSSSQQPIVQPIFIIGMMRSGSTLLETILDTHPHIWGMGEDSVFNSNLTSLRDALANAPGVSTQPFTSASNRMGGASQQRIQDNLASILAEYHVITMQEMQRLAIEVVRSQEAEIFRQQSIAQQLLISSTGDAVAGTLLSSEAAIYTKDITKLRYIVDKMLFNYRNIGFIHLVFPEAPIIHMVRDPLDTLLSCYRLKFDDIGLHWTLKIPDLVLQFVLYLETIHHFRTILPDRMVEIRYEDLVQNPGPQLKKIFQKMPGMKYDVDELLKFHENKRAVHTHSQTQVKQKLYSHSIGNWRRYATELQPLIAEFQRYVPYLDEIGALPFRGLINWEMRADFPYER